MPPTAKTGCKRVSSLEQEKTAETKHTEYQQIYERKDLVSEDKEDFGVCSLVPTFEIGVSSSVHSLSIYSSSADKDRASCANKCSADSARSL